MYAYRLSQKIPMKEIGDRKEIEIYDILRWLLQTAFNMTWKLHDNVVGQCFNTTTSSKCHGMFLNDYAEIKKSILNVFYYWDAVFKKYKNV